ncbi:MAG: IS200/IS605 family transposase [Dehalococcoidia bacterium]|nr:IS200/IS605 family transposase [Dehalococcoidia bacterium]
MPLWIIYYHIVWTTKDRLPLISPDLERPLIDYVTGKAVALETILHAINGTEDHLHLVLSIPPKLSVAHVVGHLKGASSHWANERTDHKPEFAWQRGYGVFSFGPRQLQDAVSYVHRQKEHHRDGSTVVQWLEKVSDNDEGPRLHNGRS